jgi:hypothetical protein
MENSLLIANTALAVFAGYICICRMGMMTYGRVKPAIRWQYVGLFTVLVISVVYGQPVTLGHLALTAGVVFVLSMGFGIWRHGLPMHAMRDDR